MWNKKFQLVFIIGWIQILLGCSIIFDIYELPLFIFAILGVGIIGLRSWARIPSIFCWGLYILGNLNFMKGQYELWEGISPAQPLLKLFHMLLQPVFTILLCLFAIVSLTLPRVKEQFMNKDIQKMKKRSIFIFIIFLLVSMYCYFYFPTVTPYRGKPTSQQSGEFTGRKNFAFDNFVLLVVDVGEEKCFFKNRIFPGGDDFHPPYSELDLSFGGQKFEVTSQHVGNNELKVNNVLYKINSINEHLFIGQDGKPRPESGEIHPGVQFLLTPPNEKPKTQRVSNPNIVPAESTNSQQVQAMRLAPPETPTGLTATASNGRITLTWTLVAGPTGYNFYRSVNGGAYTLFNVTPVSSSNADYTDGTVVNGATYSYEMTAVNVAGESVRSAPVSAKPI